MTTTIALAGKGGVGKTTIAALVIKYLLENRPGTILAIDADPSSNLNTVLGMPLEWTVGDIREDLLRQVQQSLTAGGAAMGTLSGGMTKQEYLDFEVRSSLAEGDRVDLIAMGRPEGPGCYCAVNHNLRQVIDSLGRHYSYIVMDNEAGMEHLSRRTTRDVQTLLIISDPSPRGITAAGRIAAFRHSLDIHIENAYLVLNGLREDTIPQPLQDQIEALDIPLLGVIPYDEGLYPFEISGRPFLEMPADSPLVQAVAHFMPQLV